MWVQIPLTNEYVVEISNRTGLSVRLLQAKALAAWFYKNQRHVVVYTFGEDGSWTCSHTSSSQ